MIEKLKDVIEGNGQNKGFVFTKMFESEHWYIYKTNFNDYEVFKKKLVHKCDWINGKPIAIDELKEAYPSNEDFGVNAWCCSSLDKAMSHIDD